ncbi:MAG: BppU family phage baseplate upper protein [Oscillospiraceae bacterium]|nr:BppU family phage baseplate upper protein [Oscillospiraceae bacterium]
MEIINHLSFDLNHRGVSQRIHATQHDANLRVVYCKILSNGADLRNIALFTPALAYKKPDGTSGLYDTLPNGDSAINIDGAASTIEVTLAEQVFTKPGLVKAAVVLRDDSLNQISTFPFDIWVEPNPSASGIVSNNYYNYQTLADINEAIQGIIDGTFSIATDSTLTAVQLPANAKATGDAIDALILDLSAIDDSTAIVAEVTGNAITLNDASNRPLRGLTLYGKTTQNGTPTPDAPVEMVDVGASSSVTIAVSGKNIFPYEKWKLNRGAYHASAVWQNGGVVLTRTTDAAGFTSYDDYATGEFPLVPVTPGKAYTFSWKHSGGGGKFHVFVINKAGEIAVRAALDADNGLYTYTALDTDAKILWRVDVNAGEEPAVYEDIQLEVGEEVTAFEASAAQYLDLPAEDGLPGLPVTSGGNYADESGQQWIGDEVDLSHDVPVKRIAELVLTGTEQWFGNTASYAGWVAAQIAVDAMAATPVMCTHYVGIAGGVPKAGQVSISNAGSVIIKDAAIGADKAALTAYIAAQYAAGTPVKVRYVLAEPVETPMEDATMAAYATLHTNKPNTTILNDAGACMKVAYVADTKAYIDNKFAALTAAIMNT